MYADTSTMYVKFLLSAIVTILVTTKDLEKFKYIFLASYLFQVEKPRRLRAYIMCKHF